jgi:hypothetical protein
MSTRRTFPWTRCWRGALAVTALACTTTATARADELVLAGPHPALKENALNIQFLFGDGLGDSFSGRGIGIGYGYMLNGPLWLDLQLNTRMSACSAFRACTVYTGNDTELMAGLAWRFRTDVPVVPYARGAVGLVYLYPDGGQSAVGLAARAGVGLKYFVYDWLGFGVEAALSLGHGYFASGYPGGRTYAVGDMAAGVEWQFR